MREPFINEVEALATIARLTEERDQLREALAAVQWNGHDSFRCVECRGQPSSGHAQNCRVGIALANLNKTDGE